VLSGVALDDCAFARAQGLDRLRIDPTCSFRRPPRCSLRTPWSFTRRRVLYEEARWRQTHTLGWASTTDAEPTTTEGPDLPASQIAGLYRNLRKALEDAKDEPGAADFYYGEMEMRRLAGRKSRRRYRNPAKERQSPRGRAPDGEEERGAADDRSRHRDAARLMCPSWAERRLLDAYWALSGYGLRAWRAVGALAILIVACTALFTLPAFARLPDPPRPQPRVSAIDLHTGQVRYAPDPPPVVARPVGFGTALDFTTRESVALARSVPGTLITTGPGTALDIALRLLAPLLLGLAILAIRGRTKR
jgi:hypothetical protein